MYTLGSLFTGIGGIDLAFQRAGFQIAFQVEIDDYCNRVLQRHWPNVGRRRDVRECSAANLPAVDVLAGGFPCQDISSAGKGAGIKEGNRSGLWFEFARLIGELRPRIVLLENVAAIIRRDGEIVLEGLTQMGYDAEWGLIPASAVGAPHRRERWFCVAYAKRNDAQLRYRLGASTIKNEYDGAGASNSSTPLGNTEGIRQQRDGAGWQSLAVARSEQNEISWNGFGSTQSIMGRAIDGLSRQLDTHRWPSRPHEDQQIWEAPRTSSGIPNRASRLKALGNAVVPQVVQPIAEAIHTLLTEADQGASRQESA